MLRSVLSEAVTMETEPLRRMRGSPQLFRTWAASSRYQLLVLESELLVQFISERN
jgi:hypothetical protein